MSGTGLRVVVLTYGTGEQHLQLLVSLDREGVERDRILVVHNPSTPGERPQSVPSECEVIGASHNLGYAAGMNLGIRHQLGRGCELLLLLTHDARLRHGALRELLDAARANPHYGVLGPVLLWTGTETPFSFGGVTGPNGTVSHRKVEPPNREGIAPCDWVDGGTMLIRAEAFDRVGDFDERFWGYCEDADLCLRMARAGFLVGVVAGASADQAPGGARRPGPWAYLLTRNGAAYAQSFAGVRGVSYMTGRAVLLALFELLRIAARLTPLRDGPITAPWAVAVGRIRGCLTSFGADGGHPPTDLPGGGDMKNIAPVAEEAGDAG